MGYFANMITTPEQRALNWKGQWIDTTSNASGVAVDEKSASSSTAYFAGIRLLAESISTLPRVVYERSTDGRRKKRRAEDHPAFELLHFNANPNLTSQAFFERMVGTFESIGATYAVIDRDGAARPRGMYPVHPHSVEVEVLRGPGFSEDRVLYVVNTPSGKIAVRRENMLDLRLMPRGYGGYSSPLELFRDSIGLTLAAERYGASFYGSGARPGGIITTTIPFKDPDAKKAFIERWNESHQGVTKANKTALLEQGMEYTPISVSPNDAQFLETRKFQVSEMARILRIPSSMIGDLERSTFSNVEQEAINFVVHSIRPRLVRWEHELERVLISGRDRSRYFIRFNSDALLRGDLKSRFEAYAIARQWGWYSANDVLDIEDQNPLPDAQGDLYMVPVNMTPATAMVGMSPDEPEPQPENDGETDSRDDDSHRGTERTKEDIDVRSMGVDEVRAATSDRLRLRESFAPMLQDAAARLIRREARELRKLAKATDLELNNRGAFLQEAERYYFNDVPGIVDLVMGPVVRSYAREVSSTVDATMRSTGHTYETRAIDGLDAMIAGILSAVGKKHAAKARRAITRALEDGTSDLDALESELRKWIEGDAKTLPLDERMGTDLAVQISEAMARQVMRERSVTRLVWRTVGENCPICREMDGRVVGINESFLEPNDVVNPNRDGQGRDEDIPLSFKVRSRVTHAPLHAGCDCVVLPA